MARRSLRPQLNQIRTWVRQGRTDAWIAHQLDVNVQEMKKSKRANGLLPEGDAEPAAHDFDDEIDLRAEDDALIAAELEAAEAQRAEQDEDEEGDEDDEEDAEQRPTRRRRGRRGGRRGSRRKTGALEATFDHGEEGYGLWLDPA